jgi:hypothetical protein
VRDQAKRQQESSNQLQKWKMSKTEEAKGVKRLKNQEPGFQVQVRWMNMKTCVITCSWSDVLREAYRVD